MAKDKDFPDFSKMTIEQLERAVRVLSASSIACESKASNACTLHSLDELTAFVGYYRQDFHALCDYHARKYGSAVFASAKECLPLLRERLQFKLLERQAETDSVQYRANQAREAEEQKELAAAEAFLLHGHPPSIISDSDLDRMLKQSTSGKCWIPSTCRNEDATCFVLVPGENLDLFAAGPRCADISIRGENAKTHPIEPCLKFLSKLSEKRQEERKQFDDELKKHFNERGTARGKPFSEQEVEQKIRELTADQRADLKKLLHSERT